MATFVKRCLLGKETFWKEKKLLRGIPEDNIRKTKEKGRTYISLELKVREKGSD